MEKVIKTTVIALLLAVSAVLMAASSVETFTYRVGETAQIDLKRLFTARVWDSRVSFTVYKDGIRLTLVPPKMYLSNTGNLVISNLKLEDSGNYTFEVEYINSEGSGRRSVTIKLVVMNDIAR